jgi:hypothetical protein
MHKQHAQKIIRETFEQPFEKARFAGFVRNLLNRYNDDAFTYHGNLIPDAYKPFVSKYERLGKYHDGENRIDILIVYLNRETSLERVRTMQRNFVAGYLQGKYGSANEKEAALVAFVSPEEADWRFSLVKMDYRFDGKGKVQEEFTPVRRWSFLVGCHEASHTAQSRLVPILAETDHNPTLAHLEEAFNIEAVTKEFFLEYRDLFIRAKEALDEIVSRASGLRQEFEAKGVNTVDFAKKLLGQIVFLYFLQKKGWFGVARDAEWGTGSKQFLRELFEGKHGSSSGSGRNFFNDILEPLFYDALRRPRDDDYYSRFNCKIPFLNGGLFDPINNYDWMHTDILLPNALFSNKNPTKQGDTGDGILDIFDRYNFTVKEDEPLEKEVAIDPELLGKAYEKFNAIPTRRDNFAEYKAALKNGKRGAENKFNKKFGVYYTPREIMHYMCRQSLIHYLDSALNRDAVAYEELGKQQFGMFGNEAKSQLGLTVEHRPNAPIPKESLETLIKFGEQVGENEAVVQARGRETGTYSYKLPESIRNNAKRIDDALAKITVCDPAIGSGAFPVGMMHEIVKARHALATFLQSGKSAYDFKRECIEKSLYGVDIDSGAVEIAKLRLWLSLVVDEEDIRQIKPLPNLDYKIVRGNSLLGVEKNLFNNELFTELERLKPLHFDETNPTKKQEYKKLIDELISEITDGHKEFDFEVYFSEVFHQKGGFDVVIANPPYISHDKILIEKNVLKKHYRCYEPFADIYCYFIEKGVRLQNQTGILSFITSNSYLRTEYGAPLRKFLRKENELLDIINLEDTQIFEEAIVNVAILLSTKSLGSKKCFVFNQPFTGNISYFVEYLATKGFMYDQTIFDSKSWSLIEPKKVAIQRKIEKGGKSLEQLGAKIRLGLATGFNEAFIIDENERNKFIKQNRKNAEIIKPILRGRDIYRYYYESPGLYILLTKNGLNVQKDYPDIYKYLDGFGQFFKKRGAQGQHWTNLRATAFFEDFKKEKIVWIELTDVGRFALCTDEVYLLNTAYFLLPPPTINIKYLIGILNSKLIHFYLKTIAETSGMGVSRWINNYVKDFPIVQASVNNQNEIIKLVDRIFAAKHADPAADMSALEREIDRVVYQLYGLTEEEIRIVEGME